MVAIGVFAVVVNLLLLTGPLFMLLVYDLALPSHSGETLLALVAGAAILYVAYGLLDVARARLQARFAVRLAQRLRAGLADGIVWLGLKNGNAEAALRVLRDLELVQQYHAGPAFALRFDVPLVPLYLLIILAIHPALGAYALAALLLLLPVAMLFHRRVLRPAARAEGAAMQVQTAATTLARASPVIRSMGMMHSMRRRLFRQHDEALSTGLQARDRNDTLVSTTRTLRLALQSGILALGGWLVIRNEMTPGGMVAASIILGRALYPADQFISQLQLRGRLREAWRRIDSLLQHVPPSSGKTPPVLSPEGVLEVRDLVIFAPGMKRPLLRGIRFVARPGRLVLVHGPNGVGKTSLLRVLARAWPPGSHTGTILLDGAPVEPWPDEAWGELLGHVPQGAGLVEGTVAQNISRFSEAAPVERIHEAARRAGVDEAIRRMGGYDRAVGPDGMFLSAGQRQQVALARALYTNPRVLLLDEPDASLDHAARNMLANLLHKLRTKGCTIIMAAHDRQLAGLADDILLLDLQPDGTGVQVAFGKADDVRRQLLSRQPEKYHIITGRYGA